MQSHFGAKVLFTLGATVVRAQVGNLFSAKTADDEWDVEAFGAEADGARLRIEVECFCLHFGAGLGDGASK
ncbi:hypothetical protein NDU88_005819 [Pleurodeles waltl]|uniref:Uncharacterized protein n=1 Tax=Pleurodeles waltl TaxID=8319 RepID=A0AAV7LAH0_PLEWA|nr:hypothetical protein NDU88_005819 [Pleurodeles waltl]